MKVALVTGAAQGLGLVTASHLAKLGLRVILSDLQDLAAASARLRSSGAEVEAAQGDISSEAFVRDLAARIERDHRALDVLVNNAGISLIAPAEDTTADQWQRVMNVNLFGPFLLCKYLGAQMLGRRAGSIVNVASVAGLAGISHRSAYNASKHGLIGLTRTLAAEWGGRGVRVNAVCPAWIKTEMDVADQQRGAYSDQDIIDRVPLARFAAPADVAQAIVFLADDEKSGYVNGATLTVDGGWTADASWERLRAGTRGDPPASIIQPLINPSASNYKSQARLQSRRLDVMQHRIEIGACPVGRLLVTHADDSLTIENVERPLRHAEGGTSDWVLRVADTETQIDIAVGIRAGHGLSFTSSWRQS